MTLPVKFRLGARYIHLVEDEEIFDIELDLGYEAWSMVEKFEIDGKGLVTKALGNEIMIDKIPMEKKWKDTFSLRVGGDYNVVPGFFALRAGGFYESPSADPAYSYVDFFSSNRFGASTGFSFQFYGVDISASYTYVYQMPVTVKESESKIYQQAPGSPCKPPYTDRSRCDENYLGKPAAPANAGVYISDYHFISAAASYTF